MKILAAMLAVILSAAAVSSCGRSHAPSTKGGSEAPNPNVPTTAEQQVVFVSAQFNTEIAIHIPPDEFASSQVLATAMQSGGTVEWWTFIRSNVGCVQQGYAVNLTTRMTPTVDGYNLDGNQLETTLEQAGVRTIQNYSLTLNPTPWGSISRSFSCVVNTGSMASLAQGQDLHGALVIPVGQRICSRWTYVNHYESPILGRGNAKVFAGTFSYTMKPLADGVQFSGDGTASVKMYLNPDNGQWTVMDFELHDPQLSVTGFSGVEQASSAQSSCPGP